MKHRNAHTIVSSALHVKSEVTLIPEKGLEDTNALRAALALVDRYKKAAMGELGLSEKNADWTMIEYAVKNDCVIVTVNQGACG